MRNRLFWVVILASLLAVLTRDLRDQRQQSVAASSLGHPVARVPRSLAMAGALQPRGAGQDETGYQGNPHLTAGNLRPGQAPVDGNNSVTGKPDPNHRLREGREVRDLAATFQVVGERMSCRLPSVNATVIVLENLALERVYEMLTRYQDSTTWEVEGVITENHCRNYILLRRAVVNSVLTEER